MNFIYDTFLKHCSGTLTGIKAVLFFTLLLTPWFLSAQFTSGNPVVLMVGDGANSLVNTGNVISLQQYTPSGTFVNATVIPSTGTDPLILSGTATSEGVLSRTPDGVALVFGGYATSLPNASSLSSSTSAVINRGIGQVNVSGVYTRTAVSSTFHSGNNIRSGGIRWVE
jgi:hypothetical protein